MTTTFDDVKNSLIAVLRNQDHRVIALKGKWGTGKTYLWRVVAAELFENKKATEQPIYVSLFGAKTINDLKLRILQNAYLKDATSFQKVMKTGSGFAKQVLQRFTGYSAEDAALLWLPELVSGRLIVFDDVERKHKSLDIDELLGMLDEYTEAHKTRFVILLNTDKLVDGENMWATLHQKVIDIEIVLDPPATESFDIAAKDESVRYLMEARAAVAALRVNNIRVIKRVLRTMKTIMQASGIDDVPPLRWVASTVLLTASHYRAAEDIPPFEYVKSFNSFERAFRDDDERPNQKELEWNAVLEKLEIRIADEYEEIVHDYLQSGLLNVGRLKNVFATYKREAGHAAASVQRDEFFTAIWWDPHKSEDDLLEMARALLLTADTMDPGSITDLVSVLERFGDFALARQFLDAWLHSVETRPEYQQMEERIFESSHRKFHPEILSKLNAMRDAQHPPLTIDEAVERISKTSSWGARERIALQRSTVEQYEEVLGRIRNDTLGRFFREHIDWIRKGPYDESFQNGVDNFVAACRNIHRAAPKSRLARIILEIFQANGLEERLSGPTGLEDQESN